MEEKKERKAGMPKKQLIGALACIVAVGALIGVTGGIFKSNATEQEVIYPSEFVTEVRQLSQYHASLAGTSGDTLVYVIKGEQEGGSTLVLGGTHANEISGHMAAILLVERAQVTKGTLYVIVRTNNSGFTYNDPGDAAPTWVHVNTPSGTRKFKYGSRATSPLDQWPDPDAYVNVAGQTLSGGEVRNLNRAYPGKADGTLTEQIAYAIVQLIKTEDITMTIDLHEASPEYPNINATVAHERAMSIASIGTMNMLTAGVEIKLEPSPVNLRGLTHRELGDFTDTYALLMETANAAQGRTRGATNEKLAITGQDKCYELLVNYGLLYVPYDENGHPLEERVGRHLQGIAEYTKALTMLEPENAVEIVNIPSYNELMDSTLGAWLR